MNNIAIPWPIKVYIAALFLFAGLLVLSSFNPYEVGLDRERAERLFEVGADGLKIVLGALMGALSMLTGKS